MSAIRIAVAAAAAVTAQTSLGGAAVNLDLPLIVVVLAALSRGPFAGVWTGAAVGFAQDVLSGGIVGASGFCKGVVGVAAGLAGERLLLGRLWQRSVIIAAATVVHAACFFGLYLFVRAASPIGGWSDVAVQVAGNAAVGAAAIGIAENAPRWLPRTGRRRPVRGRRPLRANAP